MKRSSSIGNTASEGPRHPTSAEKFDLLKSLLREMFQLDRGDLDFGIYRIMNMKADEIEAFLDNDLLPQVRTALAGASDEDRIALEAEIEKATVAAKFLEYDPDLSPKVIKLKRELAEAMADAEAESDVYGHLTDFFSRYYREGDFMSLRRYSSGGRATYLIPYDGEEVKLHWANSDQYYVKTAENYCTYAFTEGDRRVRFEIVDADNEKDNIKSAAGKQRRFVLAKANSSIAPDGEDLVVRFEHRPLTEDEKTLFGKGVRQQDRINANSAERVLQSLGSEWQSVLAVSAPTEADPGRTLLAKHIGRYTAKNSFDHFIHKDLGGFLRRELDLYLKSEVLNLDDLSLGDTVRLRRALVRMQAVRLVADKIIAFLAQLENFQKRLWLKKKFVLETQWCVTLDRVPEMLYPEIATNKAQCEEWLRLYAIDEIVGDLLNGNSGYSVPLTIDFLKANPNLVLDTCHFQSDFRDRLLAALSDAGSMDEQADGLLIHSENFQALNLIQNRYAEQVKCIYIDPPYNTENDGFIYKDRYKHSSWISMMRERIEICRKFLVPSGTFFVSIDHNELSPLGKILDDVFDDCLEGIISWRRRHNQPNDRTKMIGLVSEYILAYAKNSKALRNSGVGKIGLTGNYSNPDNDSRGEWASKPWKTGSGQTGTRYTIATPSGKSLNEEWMGSEDTYHALLNDNRIFFPSNGKGLPRKKYFRYEREEEGQCATNWWPHEQFGHNAEASNCLKALFGKKNIFNNPKPTRLIRGILQIAGRTVDLMVDFFAGSGTSGHAVIDLNRQDGGKRKYILVEMGDHFDTVLLPRMKKVVYAQNWKNGKPKSRSEGVSSIIKYIRLESYEDTLDGLVLMPPKDDLLAMNNPALVEDYRLRYALEVETAGSPCLLGEAFDDPFTYTIRVVQDGAHHERSVDLPETFNYLLGLRVDSRKYFEGVLAITGKNMEGKSCLVLWRNLKAMNNRDLERWFDKHRDQLPDSLNLVFVNGDHTLNALPQQHESWTAETIEPKFRELMFKVDGL